MAQDKISVRHTLMLSSRFAIGVSKYCLHTAKECVTNVY